MSVAKCWESRFAPVSDSISRDASISAYITIVCCLFLYFDLPPIKDGIEDMFDQQIKNKESPPYEWQHEIYFQIARKMYGFSTFAGLIVEAA